MCVLSAHSFAVRFYFISISWLNYIEIQKFIPIYHFAMDTRWSSAQSQRISPVLNILHFFYIDRNSNFLYQHAEAPHLVQINRERRKESCECHNLRITLYYIVNQHRIFQFLWAVQCSMNIINFPLILLRFVCTCLCVHCSECVRIFILCTHYTYHERYMSWMHCYQHK